ncbi:type IX secretion/gliding motility protein PorT/SprT [Galbibacter mesophilus]|uniref:type IX secretion/gliding motility protein PorT/SprT n=1 Tax=Galbibacter mesophilus TaxID=379069 RepID=UPI00191E5816|nr:porin family protein [Galbibacter mesophilus]MCM5663594.1 PorT family protein [Galbibacter mesophilus]
MKKALFLVLFSMCGSLTLFAQFKEDPILNLENEDKKRLNWGYFLGLNQYDFKFDYNEYDPAQNKTDVLVAKNFGFNVGLIGELRLNDYFDLRLEPGLYYTQRDLGFPGFSDERDFLREVKSTYIHVPLLIKASTKRLGNFKPYVVGGVSASLNLSSNQDNAEDNSTGTFRMKKSTYYYELGFGIDFYLYYFKFSPSIRGVFALTDELVQDNNPNSQWTSNINGMYSRAVFINFTFE